MATELQSDAPAADEQAAPQEQPPDLEAPRRQLTDALQGYEAARALFCLERLVASISVANAVLALDSESGAADGAAGEGTDLSPSSAALPQREEDVPSPSAAASPRDRFLRSTIAVAAFKSPLVHEMEMSPRRMRARQRAQASSERDTAPPSTTREPVWSTDKSAAQGQAKEEVGTCARPELFLVPAEGVVLGQDPAPEPGTQPRLGDGQRLELPDTSTDGDDMPLIPDNTSTDSDGHLLLVEEPDEDLHAAARKVQAAYRGHRARLPGLPDETSEDDEDDRPRIDDRTASGAVPNERGDASIDGGVQARSGKLDRPANGRGLDRASVLEEGVPPTQPVPAAPSDVGVALLMGPTRVHMRNWGRARLVAALQHLDDTEDEDNSLDETETDVENAEHA